MRIIGKLFVLPFALALSLVTLVLMFFHQIAGAALDILCGIFVICGLFVLFIDGSAAEGIRSLVIAFCISPFGLPFLAELLLDGLAGLSGSMWGYIMA